MQIEWWHGSTDPLTIIRPFLHVGTREQALMRAGKAAILHQIIVDPARTLRKRDTGSWPGKLLTRAKSQGYAAIVYLNRFEGVPLEEFEEARSCGTDIDILSDAAFRKKIPSAQDSLIILDPLIARISSIS